MAKRKKSKKRRPASVQALPVVRPNVAGLDLGSTEHWVCCPPRADCNPNVRTFGTTTPQLEGLAAWLVDLGVESVAMESTHVYWVPVYELLESRGIEVLLVNARQLHKVPGRKTDMQDCQWLQRLHACGLLRGSFRPQDAICRVRALQRQLSNLVHERTKFIQWMQKALDQMNVQVHRAVTDIAGKTGMAIIRAIVAGDRDPAQLAKLRDRRCKKSEDEIAEHLTGNWRDEHLFNLGRALQLYDVIHEHIADYEGRIRDELEALQPPDRKQKPAPSHPNSTKAKAIRKRGEERDRESYWRLLGLDLTRIDGVSTGTVRTVVTEVGLDVTKFPTESDFVSWLRLCPRTPITGGKPIRKKKSQATGANRLAAAFRMAALAVRRTKTALGATYRRKSRQKDASVAVFATARKIARYVYRALRWGQDYVDIGQTAYEARFAKRQLAAIRSAAKSMGYTLQVAAAGNEPSGEVSG